MSGEGEGWRGLRRVFRLPASARRADADVDAELRFHLDERVRELVAGGLSPRDAEAEARRRFGDVALWREQAAAFDHDTIRERRRMDLRDTISRELRQALRTLSRAPGFTVVAVLTLAVGIGAATAIFTMLDSVVLQPLPYADADRLVELTSPVPKLKGDTLWLLARHEMFYFRERARSIEDIGLYTPDEATVIGQGTGAPSERVHLANVSASLFPVLGMKPVLGRLLTPKDNLDTIPTTLVLGNGYWQRRFGGDPRVLGRTLDLEGFPMTIVGVLGPGADLPDRATDLWLPAYIDPAQAMNNHTWHAIGKLRHGYTAADAQRELAPLTARLPEVFPQAESREFVRSTGFHTQVLPLREALVGATISRALWILFASVALVLLVGAANVANLFLVRADAKRREMAVRAALGAGRVQIASRYLAESLLIATAAGVLAVGLAQGGLRVLVALAPSDLPRLAEIRLGWPSLAFVFFGAIAAGVALGLMPLASQRVDSSLLREGVRGLTSSRHRHAVRNGLMVAQIAFAVVLVAAAGLMVRSFRNLRAVAPGFDAQGVLTARIALPAGRYGRDYQRTSALYEQLTAQVRTLPGVADVGFSQRIPLDGQDLCTGMNVRGSDDPSQVRGACVPVSMVSPGFFEALGIHVAGRTPTWAGMDAHDGVVVLSRGLADRFWPGRSAYGQAVNFQGFKGWYHVAGIAEPVRGSGFDKPPLDVAYFPMLPLPDSPLWGPPTYMTMVVRVSRGSPGALARPIARLVSRLEPQAAIANIAPMADLVAASMARRSFTMVLLGIAAAMALLLGSVGIYGVFSYTVGERRGEMGIRMALGAPAARVRSLIVRQSVAVAAIGVVIGIAGAAAGTRALRALLFEVSPGDPAVLAAAAVLLLAIAAIASAVPARRASRLDPSEVLRVE